MKKTNTIILGISFLFHFYSQAQQQLTNNGNFKIHNGGKMGVFGDFINNGSLIDSGQVITLSGSTAQQIGGSSLTTFKNLTLNNSAGSYLSANEKIIGELTILSGTFSTVGYDFTLVSDNNGTARIAPILGDFSGNITMQRYIGPGVSDWRFLTAPVSGVTINDWQDNFVTSGFPGSTYPNFNFVSIYTYDETIGGTNGYGYNGATNAADPILPGTGYWCYLGPVPLTVDVTGPPVKFNHTFQVSYTPSAGAAEDGWVMIGNPYPSPIDWNSGAWSKTNINNAIYIWNPLNQQYASWVAGVGTNGGSNLIASSQSFWVQTNAANPSLSCGENIKVSTNAPFLKPTAAPLFDDLTLTLSGNNFNDETILRFGNGATNNYDAAFDARKLFSSSIGVPGIASEDTTLTDLSISSLPPISSVTHIPIKTLVNVSGNYTISIDSGSAMLNDFCIVLEDLATSQKTNFNSVSSYSFSISDTTTACRFILHVSASGKAQAFDASCFQFQNGSAVAEGQGTGPWNYVWLNSANTVIKQTLNTFLSDTIYNLSAGNYSVQISDINSQCGSFTKNIVVNEPPAVLAGFMFLRDTIIAGTADSLILQNTSTGAASYKWDFGDGSNDSLNIPKAHHYDSIGNYRVTLIARTNSCFDTLSKTLSVVLPLYINILENSTNTGLTVYPNPTNGLFYIRLQNSKQTKPVLEIFTLSGKNVYRSDLLSDQSEIDLSGYAKGVYFYSIILEDHSVLQGKIIVL